jgi:hypothetical protein
LVGSRWRIRRAGCLRCGARTTAVAQVNRREPPLGFALLLIERGWMHRAPWARSEAPLV